MSPAWFIYRIGTPFSTTEKDSLAGLGIDFREIDWSASHLQDALELDSLQVGSLQPNYFDADERYRRDPIEPRRLGAGCGFSPIKTN